MQISTRFRVEKKTIWWRLVDGVGGKRVLSRVGWTFLEIAFRNVAATAWWRHRLRRANISRANGAYFIVCYSSLHSSVPNRRRSTLVRFYARIDSEAKIDIPADGFRDRVLNINASRQRTYIYMRNRRRKMSVPKIFKPTL